MKRKLIFASDSFKGSLSSVRAGELLTEAAVKVFGDRFGYKILPVADGGEGTAEAVTHAVGGRAVPVTVTGPLGVPVSAFYGDLGNGRAILDMASASGLTLVPEELRDPEKTSTRGTGELLRAVLDAGFSDVTVGIGGSSTNDGGIGFASALGVRFLDSRGRELYGRGADLIKIRSIDLSGIHPAIRSGAAAVTVMCDVKNPLCGKNGATAVFGPQKGADPSMVRRLERGMRNYSRVVSDLYKTDVQRISGGGAAGGLGAALAVFCGAKMRSGIETLLDLVGFDRMLDDAALVVTGEGRTDAQSFMGKAVSGIGRRAAARGVPVALLCGSLGDGWESAYDNGISSVFFTKPDNIPLEEAIRRAEELYLSAAVRMFETLSVSIL